MSIPRWFVLTCLAGAAVCCVLYPLWSSRHPASARDSETHAANATNVSFQPGPSATTAKRKAAFQAFAQHPLSFERNVGQSGPSTQFVSRGPGYSLALSSEGAALSLAAGGNPKSFTAPHAPIVKTAALRMSLVGANQKAAISGLDPLPDKVNYLIGNDPTKWIHHVPHYARVKYEGVYPGIDLVYYGNQRQLEYDFVVAPGADPNQIRLSFDGTKSLKLDRATGDLVIAMASGAELRHHRPVIYQVTDNEKTSVAGSYRILDQKHATFALASYDPRRSLVIDPTLDFSKTIGGSNGDSPLGIAVDNAGNAYVTGVTFSTDFPQFGAQGPFFCSQASCVFMFVVKILPSGLFQFSTFIGANDSVFAEGIAADSTGAFIAGITYSTNFLTNTKYAFGSNNAFAADLDPTGETLHWVVGLGGGTANVLCQNAQGGDYPCGTNAALTIALDAQHAAYIGGYTTAFDFPTTEYFEGQHKSWQPVFGPKDCTAAVQAIDGGLPCQNGFVAKVPSDGNFDDGGYSTYVGGSVWDRIQAIAVDGTGHASVTGYTYSSDFPALSSNAGLPPEGDGNTAFVTRLLPDGSGAVYSYFLGGHEDLVNGNGPPDDLGNGIAVNSAGQAYVTGATCDMNFPTTPGVVQTQKLQYCSSLTLDTSLNFGGFVSVFSPLGELAYSTYFDSLGPVPAPGELEIVQTAGQSIAINPRGEIFVGGYSDANDVLSSPNPLQGGNSVGFVIKFAPDLSAGEWVTFAGTSVAGVAVQPPCSTGIFCLIASRLYTEIYATGTTPNPNNTQKNQVFISEWTDSDIVFGRLPVNPQ